MPKAKAKKNNTPSTAVAVIRRNSLNETEVRIDDHEVATANTVKTKGDTAADQVDFIQQAMERFRLAESAENKNRAEGLYDLKFSIADQWPADIKSQRGLDGRPCLTINRIKQFINQVSGDELSNRPAAQVNPVGDGSDPETASILQGMFRHIEEDSRAEQIYSRKFDGMLRKGWSWFRVLNVYDEGDSFDDQKLVIRDIPNDFCVYDDPMAQLPDRSDANWRFIVEDMPIGKYKQAHGQDVPYGGSDSMMSVGDQPAVWVSGQSVRVAEYYYYDIRTEPYYKLASGKGKFKSDLNGTETFESAEGYFTDDIDQAVNRPKEKRQLKWCKINCERIIEGPVDVPCQWIPVIPMVGDELNVDGERMIFGMVRFARDPQRMYNYWVSAQTEAIALAPKSPFLIAAGQIEGFESYWQTANVKNWPFLPYKFVTINGQPAPVPQRANAEVDAASIGMAVRQADQDLMATMGIYRASLGDVGPESSGKAILARQKESDTANANYGFNRNWSLLFCYRVILDMMPHIYNSERAIRIIRPNNESTIVQINQLFPGTEDTEEYMYDIADAAGKYAVTLSIGAPASRRQQAVNVMTEILKAEPQLFNLIGDLFVDQLDADGDWKMLMVERLKKMLPPELQDNDGDIPPEFMAKFQQLMQQNQVMSEMLQEAQRKLESNEMDNEAKKEIAQLNAEKDVLIATMKFDSVESMEAARQQFGSIIERLNMHHEKRMQDDEQAHELRLSQLERAHESRQSDKDRTHEHRESKIDKAHDKTMASAEHTHAKQLERMKPKPKPAKKK